MFWIGSGSLIIIILGIKAFLNNKHRWKSRGYPQQFNRFYFLALQEATPLLIFSGVLFFMLAVVCHINGFQLHFSSEYLYHLHISTS